MVDVATGAVVTNDFPRITLDLSTEWTPYHRDGAPDLYPEALRSEIDEVAERIYTEVNNGVYRAGFAGSPGPPRDDERVPTEHGATSPAAPPRS